MMRFAAVDVVLVLLPWPLKSALVRWWLKLLHFLLLNLEVVLKVNLWIVVIQRRLIILLLLNVLICKLIKFLHRRGLSTIVWNRFRDRILVEKRFLVHNAWSTCQQWSAAPYNIVGRLTIFKVLEFRILALPRRGMLIHLICRRCISSISLDATKDI